MSAGGESSMTFQASTAEAIRALKEAARRSRMQHLSADPATGVLVFTAGGAVLAFGEKVTARVREVAPGVVQVTLSSDLQFGLGSGGGEGAGRDRMSNALNQLLPPAPQSAPG